MHNHVRKLFYLHHTVTLDALRNDQALRLICLRVNAVKMFVDNMKDVRE
jgi:hypothetical protein